MGVHQVKADSTVDHATLGQGVEVVAMILRIGFDVSELFVVGHREPSGTRTRICPVS